MEQVTFTQHRKLILALGEEKAYKLDDKIREGHFRNISVLILKSQ